MVAPRPFGILGQQVAPAQQGILGDWGGVDSYFQDNQSALLGLASGLLQPGSFGAGLSSGLQNYMQGQQMDERRTGKRDERAAFLDMAKANGLSPQYIKMGLASEGARQAMLAQMMQPKKPEYMEFGGKLLRTDGDGGPQVVMEGQAKPDYNDPAYLFEMRKQQAAAMGITPEDPRYASFVGEGKIPSPRSQRISPLVEKEIFEADDMVAANRNVVEALQEAKRVSPNANAGWGAAGRASIANNLPGWMVPDALSSPDGGLATVELDNIVTGQALAQMKTIFGAAPTEGERKILLELQGSVNLPDKARQDIYDRAIDIANQNLERNRRKGQMLRSGTYFDPAGAQPDGSGGPPPGITPEEWENMSPEDRALWP